MFDKFEIYASAFYAQYLQNVSPMFTKFIIFKGFLVFSRGIFETTRVVL